MSVDDEDVRYMARLARLRLTDEEVEGFGDQLSDILGYVEKLNELDTDDVEPTTHAVGLVMALRDDEVERRLTREEVLANAPDTAEGHFRVPKVVED